MCNGSIAAAVRYRRKKSIDEETEKISCGLIMNALHLIFIIRARSIRWVGYVA
jgi:hypothetical protein